MDKELIKSKIKTNVYQITSDSNVALHKHQMYDEIFYCIKAFLIMGSFFNLISP